MRPILSAAQMRLCDQYTIDHGTPSRTLMERAARAAAVAKEMQEAYLAACIGEVYPVLYEQKYDELYCGHAPNYATVAVDGDDLHNCVLPTRITAVGNGVLLGELVKD